MRGISLNPSSLATPNPISDWPWESTYASSMVMSVPCRTTPSIIAATSEAEQLISWLWTATDPVSICQ